MEEKQDREEGGKDGGTRWRNRGGREKRREQIFAYTAELSFDMDVCGL